VTRTFEGCHFDLRQGDITKIQADAIVNAANSALSGGGGVDGAIHKAAGPALLEECLKLTRCPPGQSRVTGAGNLQAKHVIHAVGPVWWDGTRNEPELLASAYQSCLDHAHRLALKSIAFPAISTGVYGYPLDPACAIALGTCREFVKTHQGLDTVVFVLFSALDLGVYERHLKQLT
jgi:O-acetyl-ADP-ribose deacetylase (regulator of RNase III)